MCLITKEKGNLKKRQHLLYIRLSDERRTEKMKKEEKMKKLTMLLVAAFTMSLMVSCGGSGETTKSSPYNELAKIANTMRKNGAVADVGQGQSKREDLAREKAQTDGRAKIAMGMEVKVQALQKKFVEEIGSNEDTEINEAFSSVTKQMASTVLQGVFPEEERMVEKDGMITIYVLMAVDPSTFNQSLMDEMKSKPKVYERFRASQAYDELKNEMDTYEAQQ